MCIRSPFVAINYPCCVQWPLSIVVEFRKSHFSQKSREMETGIICTYVQTTLCSMFQLL